MLGSDIAGAGGCLPDQRHASQSAEHMATGHFGSIFTDWNGLQLRLPSLRERSDRLLLIRWFAGGGKRRRERTCRRRRADGA